MSRRALELVRDGYTAFHVIWLALDDLLDDGGGEARSLLDGLDLSTFDAKNRYLYRLARLLLDLQEARPDVPRIGGATPGMSWHRSGSLCRSTRKRIARSCTSITAPCARWRGIMARCGDLPGSFIDG